MDATPHDTAGEVLDVVPQVMSAVRTHIRYQQAGAPSVAEFRTLSFLDRHPGASLSDVADHLGLTLPSMSIMVNGLVERGYVKREDCATDRRRVTLMLTGRGRTTLQAARVATQAYLAQVLGELSPTERATITQAMRLLRPLFISDREKEKLTAKQ